MLCKFERLVYPRDSTTLQPDSYMVALYLPCEQVMDGAGNVLHEVKVVGYCLPMDEKLKYDIDGHWVHGKHGLQFEMERFKEMIPPTKEGIISYLSSGQIRGVGRKTAEKIFNTFQLDTLRILDNDPKKLLTIPGISQKKLERILESYLTHRGARDVITLLAPYGVSANRSIKLYQKYGNDTIDILRKQPYKICEIAGIGFKTADDLAMKLGYDPLSPERVDEGAMYTLEDAEGKGNLCMEKHEFVAACQKLLQTPALTADMVAARALRLVKSGRMVSYKDVVYRKKAAMAEHRVALRISERLKNNDIRFPNLEAELTKEEISMNITLAKEQRNAVRTALSKRLCVITGGPGTGKTSVQKAILDMYRKAFPESKVVCCAPTGRAARRMEQSTGLPASTIHRALGLMSGDDDGEGSPLEADFVLVDEVSMLDIYLAEHLLNALTQNCQLVLVGDSDQLPSVGPGAVLSEIIASSYVPVVRLDKVYRQKEGSRIAVNAKLIRHGNLGLEYGPDFHFVESATSELSADKIQNIYLKEVEQYGVDNVALLSPFRQKTETGVNALNDRIRALVNPSNVSKSEITYKNRTYRVGDKVMQTKNMDEVSNGDIGYITAIKKNDEGEVCTTVDFGEGRKHEYYPDELDVLDLGYACTVHKSQGGEYKSVIINLQSSQYIMLVRPLIYTAITRAKERVIIVGERRALCMAIKRTETEQRGTRLAQRIQELLQ